MVATPETRKDKCLLFRKQCNNARLKEPRTGRTLSSKFCILGFFLNKYFLHNTHQLQLTPFLATSHIGSFTPKIPALSLSLSLSLFSLSLERGVYVCVHACKCICECVCVCVLCYVLLLKVCIILEFRIQREQYVQAFSHFVINWNV